MRHDLRRPGEDDRDQDAEVGRAPAPRAPADQILALQRSAGNAAVQRMLADDALGAGGLMPGVPVDETQPEIGVGGFGETVGDIARPIGTGIGNAFGGAVGALTGISISTTTNTGPTWNDHGAFDWRVGIATTGTSGWIVQEVNNTLTGTGAGGGALGGWKPTPKYWEAWEVDAASVVSPAIAADNDYWIRPTYGTGTKGHWSMTGHLYFTTTDPKTQGFVPYGVPDAQMLLSSTTAPTGLGLARLHRYAQGTWDSTGATPTHTGSAGPA
jgi:hypothetical protein